VNPWTYTVGMLPHRVTAYEDVARKGIVYLRWRVAGDWKRKSLGFAARDAKGKLSKDATVKAQQAADAQYGRLVSGGHAPAAPVAELTISGGWMLATDPERGYWTQDTPHRKEMQRAIDRAKSVWGASTSWNAIDRGEVRRLWRAELKRQRAKGNDGVRSAEIIVARVMALAAWLRDEGKVNPTACAPWKLMKQELAVDCGDYAPKRLRYSGAEFRALLATAGRVDPRWDLLLTLGAEYRLGQVVRVRRSEVDRAKALVVIRGKGKKRGVTIALTRVQRETLEHALTVGHLAGLEAAYEAQEIVDYPLFPGRKLPVVDGGPVTNAKHATRAPLGARQLRAWLAETEQATRVDGKPIAHVEGRGRTACGARPSTRRKPPASAGKGYSSTAAGPMHRSPTGSTPTSRPITPGRKPQRSERKSAAKRSKTEHHT
jgi:integrase